MLLPGEQDFTASSHDSSDANSLVMVTLRQATSINVSNSGVYFKTSSAYFLVGMEVYVTSDFVVDGSNPEEIMGAGVRIDKLEGSDFGVAIHFLPAI
jgi:hypothetical protein